MSGQRIWKRHDDIGRAFTVAALRILALGAFIAFACWMVGCSDASAHTPGQPDAPIASTPSTPSDPPAPAPAPAPEPTPTPTPDPPAPHYLTCDERATEIIALVHGGMTLPIVKRLSDGLRVYVTETGLVYSYDPNPVCTVFEQRIAW